MTPAVAQQPATDAGTEVVSCSLCGTRYATEAAVRPCAACPLQTGCGLTCCPNCGYQEPEGRDGFTGWVRRLVARGRAR